MISTKDKTLLLPLECGELFHAVSAFVLFSRTEGGVQVLLRILAAVSFIGTV